MYNTYTYWLDVQLLSLFLEILETIKAVQIAEQYKDVTERIKKFHRRPNIMEFIMHWQFGLI